MTTKTIIRASKTPLKNIHGILLLDKPKGLSSNAALQMVKRLFKAKKAGHTGSLDPLATGMLPLCFGEATKFSQFLLDSDKTYQVEIQFGVKTTTGDAEGEVVKKIENFSLSAETLAQTLTQFQGEIEQIPSMYSALKYQGTPLYKLARQGIEVPRAARTVTIYAITLMSFSQDCAMVEVSCSKGTYIRTLAEDIGDKLGMGAHVKELRRTQAGPYFANQMVTMSQLEAIAATDENNLSSLLLPMDTSVQAWPNINLTAMTAHYLRLGQPVLIPHAPRSGYVQLKNPEGRFLGVGVVLSDGRIAPSRLVSRV